MIVFESMSKLDMGLAWFLALAGRQVKYIKKPRRSARALLAAILRQRFFRKRIRPCHFAWDKDYFDGMWGDRAFSEINKVYSELSKASFVKILLARFGLAAEFTIKKELTTQLSRFFYLNTVLGDLNKRFCTRIIFVPSSGIEHGYYTTNAQEVLYYNFLNNVARTAGVLLEQHEKTSFLVIIWIKGLFLYLLEFTARHVRMAGCIVKYFAVALKNLKYPKLQQSWRYGVMIMSTDRQFQNDTEGLGFLIDGSNITKDEVVFIPHSFVKLGNRELGYIKSKGLNCINNLRDFFSFSAWTEMVSSCLRAILTNKLFMLKGAYALCVESALWRSFSDRVHLDNVIGHHDVSVSALCRNIILAKQQGTQSWLYIDANNFTVFFAPSNGQIRYKTNFDSFLCFNHVVCWNKKIEKIFLASENRVDVYDQLGCLWSTFIERQRLAVRPQESRNMRTLAVFDSTYHECSVSNLRCAYFFYRGILHLLNSMDNTRVIIKPKKSRNYFKFACKDISIFRVMDMLIDHPRCELMDYAQSRGEIVAQADLVIAYPFTSPAFEAVCAGVPAIYFDATGAFSGSIYQECGMVASGYDELVKKVEYFLSLPKEEFYKWRLKHQSIFDEHLDGRGLDRFIKKLAGTV